MKLNPQKNFFRKSHSFVILSVLVGTVFIAMMLFMFGLGKTAIERHAPQVDAIMEVQVELTTAHLWLEEILSGDRSEDPEIVWSHFNKAKWYVNALLKGAVDYDGNEYQALSPENQPQILQIYSNVHRLSLLAKQRVQNMSDSQAGSYDDKLFDGVFRELEEQMDTLERKLLSKIRGENKQFQSIGYLLIGSSILGVFILTILIYFLEKGKEERLLVDQDAKNDLQLQKAELEYEALIRTKELTDANLKFKNNQKLARIGNWERNIETGIANWSEEVFEIFDRPYQKEASFELAVQFIHPDDQQKVIDTVEASIADRTDCNVEYRAIKPNGDICYIHSFAVITEWSADGKPLVYSGVLQDVTNSVELQNALIKAKEEAENATRTKSEFLAKMSHEIRTPMNAIIGMTHLALQTDLDNKQKNYISKTHYSAENLLGIINDLLDFSKIEANKLQLESVPFTLKMVLDNLLNMIQLKAEEAGLQIRVHIDKDVPKQLIGDPLRLGQVLINLATNAVKFTESGGQISLNIELKSENSDGIILQFSVQDTGIGLSKEQQESLFHSFSQADSSTTRKYGGTGLGLVIAQKIVYLMNGNIWLESEENKGSTFFFTVRLQKNTAPETMEVTEQTDISLEQSLEKLKNTRILLVEDNEINQELACELLEMNGMSVVTAENGQEAIELLSNNEFDGILMDCMMPVMDGYEATQKIRNQEQYLDLPIIAMTANAMQQDIDKVLVVGMNDHIAKPINPEKMLATMARWINC